VAGFGGAFALLATLAGLSVIGTPGLLVGLVVAITITGCVGRGLARSGADRLGPADRVTMGRAVLVVAVTALVVDSWTRPAPAALLSGLAAIALLLDWVDGRVARRTATVSRFGALFDMEIDALLILALSIYVAAGFGWWVLVLGAAHYLLHGARRVWPWLAAPLPPRYWCKVAAASIGIILTAVTSGTLPTWLSLAALVVAVMLLVESFGREIWQLRRAHTTIRAPRHPAAAVPDGAVARGLAGVRR
jgi:phosphatidylglycerophosphate synthase